MNTPVLSTLEEKNAPWNDKQYETQTYYVTVNLTISHTFKLDLNPHQTYTDNELLNMIEYDYGIKYGGEYGRKYDEENIDWDFEDACVANCDEM